MPTINKLAGRGLGRSNPREQFNRAMQRVDRFTSRAVRSDESCNGHDERLTWLFRLGASVAENAVAFERSTKTERDANRECLADSLAETAAFCIVWNSESPLELNAEVACVFVERQRQEDLHSQNKLTVQMNSPVADARRKFRIVAEEIGEVADAIDKMEVAKVLDLKRAALHLQNELVQVAAVCVAWLESLEVQS